MADYERRTFTPKYEPQSEEYGANVGTLKEKLASAIAELDGVENTLGLDPENAHDILTYNVIIGNSEIKDEIKTLVSDLDFYTSEVSDQAKKFDQEDEAEFNRQEDARIASLQAQANEEKTEEES
jgi:hypothetical protein